jgi:hypothetical protein
MFKYIFSLRNSYIRPRATGSFNLSDSATTRQWHYSYATVSVIQLMCKQVQYLPAGAQSVIYQRKLPTYRKSDTHSC